MSNEAAAKKAHRRYVRRLNDLTAKARQGDCEAARQIIVVLTEMIVGLRELGYRTTDENEPGKPGRLVPITQEWIAEQKAKETEMDRLAKKARNGDIEASRELIRRLAAGN